jgi:hypothetical protein
MKLPSILAFLFVMVGLQLVMHCRTAPPPDIHKSTESILTVTDETGDPFITFCNPDKPSNLWRLLFVYNGTDDWSQERVDVVKRLHDRLVPEGGKLCLHWGDESECIQVHSGGVCK